MNHESVARVEFRLYAMKTNTFIPVFHDNALSRIGSKSEIDWLFPTSKIRVGNGFVWGSRRQRGLAMGGADDT
jgi:hypothetical protein